jgi:hypothetical protein
VSTPSEWALEQALILAKTIDISEYGRTFVASAIDAAYKSGERRGRERAAALVRLGARECLNITSDSIDALGDESPAIKRR